MNKIIFKSTNKGHSLQFSPECKGTNALKHLDTLINVFPSAVLQTVTSIVPYLRPATPLERENRMYIFREGEEGALENKLYTQRKCYYDMFVSLFQQLLSCAFPDVEYIEGCRAYQQALAFDENSEELEKYKEKLQEVATEIRTNFNTYIKEMLDEANKENQKMAEVENEGSEIK